MGEVKITCPEFTSLCPLTGQPDFATIVIRYTPGKWCVESKSLKLYLGSFRNVGEFHESCIARIAKDLVTLLEPSTLIVRGKALGLDCTKKRSDEGYDRGEWPGLIRQDPSIVARVDSYLKEIPL